MVTTFYPPYHFGGDALFVYHLSNLLTEQGHLVEVIHCIDSFALMNRMRLPDLEFKQGKVTVNRLKSPLGPISPLLTHQTGHPFIHSAKLKRLLGKGFDVIHFHNISLVGGAAILKLGSGLKLYTVHEYWLLCPMHNLFKFNRRVCLQRKCIACSLFHKRPPQWWRYTDLIKRSLQRVDALIAPSRFARQMHASAGLPVPVVHMPGFVPENGANDSRSAERRMPAKRLPEPYFLFVGRLEKIKGVWELIQFFRSYDKACLLIAGKGAERERLERAAAFYDHIHFYGHLPHQRLNCLYRNAKALIAPSLAYEVSPLVIMEAFRNGTPVIARNRGALAEMVETSGAGATFDTEEELEGILARLLSDAQLRLEWGRRARGAYERHWSPAAHLDRYLALIRELSNKKMASVGISPQR